MRSGCVLCLLWWLRQSRFYSGHSVFLFQAEDGIRDLVRSRGLGDVYKRQAEKFQEKFGAKFIRGAEICDYNFAEQFSNGWKWTCLLYTSDAADERSSVDLGGRRIIKKNKKINIHSRRVVNRHTIQHTTHVTT